MHDLPSRPDIRQLRNLARDLLRAAQAGDPAAADRIGAVSGRTTLAAAQLAVAREYGFASWSRLKAEVEARTTDLAKKADMFLDASIRDNTGRAARMLAGTPEIAGYDFRTAVVLGEVDRVRGMLRGDPGLATRHDALSGWMPLHVVSSSRWHRLDPSREGGLLAVARLLLEAGADAGARTGTSGHGRRDGGWSPLRCAVAGAVNPQVTKLLLEHGAVPDQHDLYLAGFGDDDHQCLRLLLSHFPDTSEAGKALAAPISMGDTEGVRLLLEAGADPRCYANDDGEPCSAVYAAIRARCDIEVVKLLLDGGADPDAAGPDGSSPYRLATRQGRSDLATLLRHFGAGDDATEVDRFLSACLRVDHTEARQLADHAGLSGQLAVAGPRALVHAAEADNTAAVGLMLDLGFGIESRGGDEGSTALHAAAYSGSADTVRFLLDRGADIEARDTTWDSTPLVWAIIGSGERPQHNPSHDWIATVRTLLEAGAPTQGITLSPDDHKPPSPDVAHLLQEYGIGSDREAPGDSDALA